MSLKDKKRYVCKALMCGYFRLSTSAVKLVEACKGLKKRILMTTKPARGGPKLSFFSSVYNLLTLVQFKRLGLERQCDSPTFGILNVQPAYYQ